MHETLFETFTFFSYLELLLHQKKYQYVVGEAFLLVH